MYFETYGKHGMVVYTSKTSTWEAELKVLKFEAILSYLASSRPA
jgi:hypothetical protein